MSTSGALSIAVALLGAVLALTAANALFGLGGHAWMAPLRDWGSSAVYVLVAAIVAIRTATIKTSRRPWIAFTIGLSLYGLGNLFWSLWIEHLQTVPIPSICDGLWLSLYPFCYVGVVGMARSQGDGWLPAGVWLDGVIAGAGLAALGAALVFGPVLASASGGAVAVATELAYPIFDLLLAALVVGVLATRGWRVDRFWGLLVGGFLMLAVADCKYAVDVANGASSPTALTNLLYVLAVAIVATAAWQHAEPARHRLDNLSTLLVPAGFALTALGVLIYDHFHRIDPVALGFSILTLITAVVRMGLAFRDVHSLAEARHQASTDDLTALPNRRRFMRLTSEAVNAARITESRLSLMIIDLNHFKELNDTLGHQAGDAVLRLIGPRIKGALRATDVVARLGGDEFGILLDPETDEAGVTQVAEKILLALREPFAVQGLSLCLTASLGIASFPGVASGADELIQQADVAMYCAKRSRTGFEFYARERDTNSRERLVLVAELAHALEHGGIEVHFQPKADARTRRIMGAEALVRWRRPDGHLVMPGDFIGAAEHAGLSRALTRKVVELVLPQLARWRHAGQLMHVAINASVADLLDMEFPEELAAALLHHDIPPHALIVEVTESAVLSDTVRIGSVLAKLAELGIGLSLDDFGTGYSSLTHLRTLPVSEIKIDRSFVGRMSVDEMDSAIVMSTIMLAHRLGIRVVAEGVEDELTWERLVALHCELIQGYALSRPVPACEFERMFSSRPALTALAS